MIYTYVIIGSGVYLVVAQKRGRLVGMLSSVIWPLLLGMLIGLKCQSGENDVDWDTRVTWLPKY